MWQTLLLLSLCICSLRSACELQQHTQHQQISSCKATMIGCQNFLLPVSIVAAKYFAYKTACRVLVFQAAVCTLQICMRSSSKPPVLPCGLQSACDNCPDRCINTAAVLCECMCKLPVLISAGVCMSQTRCRRQDVQARCPRQDTVMSCLCSAFTGSQLRRADQPSFCSCMTCTAA